MANCCSYQLLLLSSLLLRNRRGDQVPRLYFPVNDSDYLDYDHLSTVYHVTEEPLPDTNSATRLQLIVGEYSVDGEFLGYHSVERGLIQLCPDTTMRLDAAYDIGVDYRQQVYPIQYGRTASVTSFLENLEKSGNCSEKNLVRENCSLLTWGSGSSGVIV